MRHHCRRVLKLRALGKAQEHLISVCRSITLLVRLHLPLCRLREQATVALRREHGVPIHTLQSCCARLSAHAGATLAVVSSSAGRGGAVAAAPRPGFL